MDLMTALAGVIAALVAQLTKAEGWNPWVKKLYAGLLGGAGSLITQGTLDPQIAGLVVAIALATHSFLFSNTAVGATLKWNILGKLANVVKAIFPGE